jgi:hypothetical protein
MFYRHDSAIRRTTYRDGHAGMLWPLPFGCDQSEHV